MDLQARRDDLKAEILRISAKLQATSDPDVAEALRFKLEALNTELQELEKAIEEEAAAAIKEVQPKREATPAEIETLIRHARAHFSADRKPALRQALSELDEVAPNHPDVLELKADQMIAAKDFVHAKPILQQALKLAPKSKSIEEKLALVSLKSTFAGSLEDQLRMGLSDTPLLTDGDIKASPTAATIASALIPGAGHLFLGMSSKAAAYMIFWFGSMIPLILLIKSTTDRLKGFELTMPMIFLAFIGLMTYMLALFECASVGKRQGKRKAIERPKPPVDLPFE